VLGLYCSCARHYLYHHHSDASLSPTARRCFLCALLVQLCILVTRTESARSFEPDVGDFVAEDTTLSVERYIIVLLSILSTQPLTQVTQATALNAQPHSHSSLSLTHTAPQSHRSLKLSLKHPASQSLKLKSLDQIEPPSSVWCPGDLCILSHMLTGSLCKRFTLLFGRVVGGFLVICWCIVEQLL
jgi:hypothetical protein